MYPVYIGMQHYNVTVYSDKIERVGGETWLVIISDFVIFTVNFEKIYMLRLFLFLVQFMGEITMVVVNSRIPDALLLF